MCVCMHLYIHIKLNSHQHNADLNVHLLVISLHNLLSAKRKHLAVYSSQSVIVCAVSVMLLIDALVISHLSL